jgi:hypothetical protein
MVVSVDSNQSQPSEKTSRKAFSLLKQQLLIRAEGGAFVLEAGTT